MSRNMLSIASVNGDDVITWDPEIEAEVEEALAAFTTEKEKSHPLIYKEDEPGKGEQISEFDPHAKAIYMTPQLQGG